MININMIFYIQAILFIYIILLQNCSKYESSKNENITFQSPKTSAVLSLKSKLHVHLQFHFTTDLQLLIWWISGNIYVKIDLTEIMIKTFCCVFLIKLRIIVHFFSKSKIKHKSEEVEYVWKIIENHMITYGLTTSLCRITKDNPQT